MTEYLDLAENPFKLVIQSRLADTDSLQHINNAAFVEYLETARTHWHNFIREDPRSLDNWDWILGGIHINFRKEALLSDTLTVLMWCSRIGTKSWDFSYVILNQHQDVILEARTSQISYDYQKKISMPIAPDILEDLQYRQGKAWPSTP